MTLAQQLQRLRALREARALGLGEAEAEAAADAALQGSAAAQVMDGLQHPQLPD
jgi:hypothetical protein